MRIEFEEEKLGRSSETPFGFFIDTGEIVENGRLTFVRLGRDPKDREEEGIVWRFPGPRCAAASLRLLADFLVSISKTLDGSI